MTDELEQITIESVEELRNWLGKNHTCTRSVWLVTWKKNSGHPYVSYDDIVDQCLCFGWIDSLSRKFDEKRSMLRISPRSPKSNWSRTNKNRVQRLTDAGLMKPRGLAMVSLAKQNGTWNFLDDVEDIIIPDDLAKQFEKHPQAYHFFSRFPPSSQRGILEWIKSAKTDKTRNKRIIETALKAAHNIKANYPEGKNKGPSSGA